MSRWVTEYFTRFSHVDIQPNRDPRPGNNRHGRSLLTNMTGILTTFVHKPQAIQITGREIEDREITTATKKGALSILRLQDWLDLNLTTVEPMSRRRGTCVTEPLTSTLAVTMRRVKVLYCYYGLKPSRTVAVAIKFTTHFFLHSCFFYIFSTTIRKQQETNERLRFKWKENILSKIGPKAQGTCAHVFPYDNKTSNYVTCTGGVVGNLS